MITQPKLSFQQSLNKYTLVFHDPKVEEFYLEKKSEIITNIFIKIILVSFLIVYFVRRIILLVQAYQNTIGSNPFYKELTYFILSSSSLILEFTTILVGPLRTYTGIPSQLIMTWINYDSVYESFFIFMKDRIIFNNLSLAITIVSIFIGLFMSKSFLKISLAILSSLIFIILFYLIRYRYSIINGIFYPIFFLVIYLMIIAFIYIFDYFFRMNIYILYRQMQEIKEWKGFLMNYQSGIVIFQENHLKYINKVLWKNLEMKSEYGTELLDIEDNSQLGMNIRSKLFEIKDVHNENFTFIDIVNMVESKEDSSFYMSLRKIDQNVTEHYEVTKSQIPLESQNYIVYSFKEITACIMYKELLEKQQFLKNSFVSITHDMRNPLGCIITSLENVQSNYSNPNICDFISVSLSSANLLLCSVNDILDLNLLENNKLKFALEEVNIRQILSDCIRIMKVNFNTKGLKLESYFDPIVLELIYSDKNRIKGIVLNILSNALKFTRHGGVNLKLKNNSEDSKIKISIRDTGKGIDENSMNKIFSMFGKLDGNQEENPTGAGIGLAFSRKMAKMLGGNIKFNSLINKGSKFVVWLSKFVKSNEIEMNLNISDLQFSNVSRISEYIPLEENLNIVTSPSRILNKNFFKFEQKEIDNIPDSTTRIPYICSCPKVLIVDDNELVHNVLRSQLLKFQIYSSSVYNGEEALKYLIDENEKKCCEGIKLIFMDINLNSDMDGYQTTSELKKYMKSKRIKESIIIGISGDLAEKRNMDEIEIKPLKIERLKVIIDKYLRIFNPA